MYIQKAPPWRNTLFPDHYPAQSKDISVDVLIIGGGIAGIATAYELSGGDKKIALIEKAILGSGATNHTTAFLSQIIDTDLSSLVSMFGNSGAKHIWESGGKAIDLIEKNVKKEKIDCGFTRCSYYEFALTQKDEASLQEEEKMAKKLGFPVEYHTDKKLGFTHFGYNEIKHQGKFHPLKYIYGLAKAARKKGIQIFEHTQCLSLSQKDSFIAVKTNHGVINARQVIITTYAPCINKWEHFFKAAYYEDFMMELEIPKNSIQEALFADTNTPYTYFRIDPKKTTDHMIIGGLTHRIQVPMDAEKGYQALETWIKKLFPDLSYTMLRKWSGRLIETDDGIPYIGKLTGYKNVYVATGFSGNGMTYSHISAMIFADILNERENEWAKLYDAKRIPKLKSLIQKGKDYSSTLIGGIKQHISIDTSK